MPAAPRLPQLPDEIERERPRARLRLFGLLAVVVLTAALPLAGASAGPVDDGPTRQTATEADASEADVPDGAEKANAKPNDKASDKASDSGDENRGENGDAKPAERNTGKPSLLTGLGLTTEAHCGPQLSAPDGIEAQTCVLVQGHETWARTYYRNATGSGLAAVLTLMAPGGRTVQLHCAVGVEDEPGMCETPRGRTRGEPGQYTAVAEYAKGAEGPLLLRSGSNSAPLHGG
ncbi:hypothetical protein OG746_05540 [Streptomyces sp. NBC_01016]|uniref:hypothetical protein n=1 Tax=Streptomyces sp. NBC_01016 TaxID=2903720 RepID=UPI0022545AEB|nr:hypothetical protein [Streptomyces sp. NBC_01016]MCX4828198.1 hypothetical protein [Streptomyces sp. NBC_01016]